MATANLYWPYPPNEVGTWIWGYPGHQGTDWPKPTGTAIPATSDGVVVFAGDDGLGGLTVDLQRGDGLIQRFGHMSRILVSVGQRVTAGQTIGLVGSTGNSTGPHLHWELRWDRVWNGGRVVDPRTMNPSTFGSNPTQSTESEEDDAMAQNVGISYIEGKKQINAIVNTTSGYFGAFESNEGGYNTKVAQGFQTPSFALVSKSHFEAIQRDCAAVRAGK